MKNAIISFLIMVIIIMMIVIINISKKNTVNYWCDLNNYKKIEGKILEVENNKLLIKSGDFEYIINHKSTFNYKTEQYLTIIYDGAIMESLPPQINAILIIVNE